MTTITIECELLEQALEALELATEDYDDSAVGIEIESIHSLRAALSAPATAPEPSWQDAPTVPGMWACLYMGELSTAIFNAYEIEHFDASEMGGCRWKFIPEDKP